jgi:hypothetical protein
VVKNPRIIAVTDLEIDNVLILKFRKAADEIIAISGAPRASD